MDATQTADRPPPGKVRKEVNQQIAEDLANGMVRASDSFLSVVPEASEADLLAAHILAACFLAKDLGVDDEQLKNVLERVLDAGVMTLGPGGEA